MPISRRRRVAKIVGWIALGTVLVLSGAGGYEYLALNHNIHHVDPSKDLAGPRPASFPGVLDVLVIGSDSRLGLGNRYGDAGSVGHADTTLVVHVSADRSNASVISIPRDLMVDQPDCFTPSGRRIAGSPREIFNASLGQDGRGPGCVIKTVEKLTGIRIDHFVMVDFNAVKTMSSALGGVEVCTRQAIDDAKSGLHLRPGRHRISGDQALAFVRTRHGVGYGSDLDRIKLQQQFIGSLVRQAKSAGTVTNPRKLLSVANAATKALTVDPGIGSLRDLMALARNVDQVDSRHITFATVPVLDSPRLPQEMGRLVLEQPNAEALFAWVRADRSLSGGRRPGAASPSSAATAGAAQTTAPVSGPPAPTGVNTVGANEADCVG